MNGRSREKLVFMVLASALLLIALSSVALGGTPPSIEWSQNFGGTGNYRGYSVEETSDGGYIVTGTTYSEDKGNQVYLLKTDAKGNNAWEKKFGGGEDALSLYNGGYCVQQTSDGGYIVAGTMRNSSDRVYLLKTDAKGNITWEKEFSGVGDCGGSSVQQTSDGGYIVAGHCTDGSSVYTPYSSNLIYLIKTDPNGNELWASSFGYPARDYGSSVRQTADGGYIVVGTTQPMNNGNQVYLVKTDASGNITWDKEFGGPEDDGGSSVQQTSDEGYIVAGTTYSEDKGSRIYLVKTDASGNIIWDKDFGGPNNEGYSVQQTEDGGYIVAGNNLVVKTDASGNKTWEWYSDSDSDSEKSSNSVRQTEDGGYIVAGTLKEYYGQDGDYRNWVYLAKLNYIKTGWAKVSGGLGDDGGSSVQQTADGGYIVAGHTTSSGNGDQAYLLKTDTNGDKSWENNFGGKGSDDCRSVQKTSDGGYILAGTTESFGNGSQIYLVKTYESGSEIWEKAYGEKGDEGGYSVQQTSDGGYIATGTTTSFGNGSQVYLVKTDAKGNITWEKDFGGPGDEGGYSVKQVSDGYIVAGYTTSFGKRYQVYLLKTNLDGKYICEKDFGGNEDEWGYSVNSTSDGYVVAGYTTSFGKHYQAYLLKTDINGNKIWEKDFGGEGEERAYSVQQTPDKGYIIAGYATPYFNGSQVYVVKTDADGNELWHYRFGGAGDEGGMSIANTDDGNYIVAGATNSFGNGDQVYLAKLVNLGSAVKSSLPQGMIGLNNSTKISTSAQPNHLQSKRSLPAAKQMKQPKRAKILSK